MKRSSRTTTDGLLPQAVEKHLDAGEFDAVEEAWMTRLEEDPLDVGYYAALARGLGRVGEADTARFLLELLDEQLREGEEWPTRLELLRRVGTLMVDAEDLHPAILATLSEIHGHRPSYAQMIDKVGLHRAVDDLPKTWKKAERLAGLLALDVGSIVHMDGRGAGRVEEVNMALESFKVVFEDGLEIRVGFGGATKLLSPLAPDHILHRKMEEPDALAELRDASPEELLRTVFESHEGPLTGAEIKRILSGIVAESGWTSWWAAARKHPQVIVAPGSKRAYVWAASSEDAQDAVWQSFETAEPRARMDLLRRDGGRDAELRERMSAALAEQAAELAGDDPGLACEIWFNLERSGELPPAAEWSPRALITELDDPRPLFAGIRDKSFREQSYRLAQEHRQDWPELFGQLLAQEQDARSLDLLAAELAEHAPQRLESFLDQVLSQPKKAPAAFVWFAERAADKPEWLARSPIRLLKQILWTLSDAAFSSFRASRLLPLADSGGTLPRLLPLLEEAQATEAENALERASALESYQRDPLINAIHLKFPSLRREAEAPLYATQEKIDAKRAELKELAEVDIPANRRAIKEAREMGDLSENFEYKSARQRHEYLSARAQALSHDLTRVRRIDPSQVTGEEVVIGCRVRLAGGGGERTIAILGPWESDPDNDVLSSESELAQALLGRAPGDRVDIAGVSWEVADIEPWA